jgi:hypothetical protein
VPSQFSETNRVRTGYETVVAHRTGETFACIAKRDGVVEDVNDKLGLIKIRYHSVKSPALDLMHISNSNVVRNKFVEMATAELARHNPIYIVQDDEKTTSFKRGDFYTLNDHTVKVIDILPLDLNHLPMDYLTATAKDVLKKAKHPVLVKLMPASTDSTDDVDIFKFGTKFSSVSGSYLKQTIIANVKEGDKVSRGDVIAYNTGFFEQDQFDPKQVTWKHGVMTRIALMEGNDTIEDSNAITEEYSRRMQMEPAHVRTVEMTSRTILRDLLPLGTEVQTTDLLCTLEDADIGALTDTDDTSMLDLLNELNRKAPRARYHGIVSEFDVLYSCPIEDMHPSVATVVKKIESDKLKLSRMARGTNKSAYYAEPSVIAPGTKFKGIEFGKDTIILLVYISEHIDHGSGDKLVVCNQAKSVTATVIEKPISTVSGYPIDMLFSARGFSNRILNSPIIVGFTNRVLVGLEQLVVADYFKE